MRTYGRLSKVMTTTNRVLLCTYEGGVEDVLSFSKPDVSGSGIGLEYQMRLAEKVRGAAVWRDRLYCVQQKRLKVYNVADGRLITDVDVSHVDTGDLRLRVQIAAYRNKIALGDAYRCLQILTLVEGDGKTWVEANPLQRRVLESNVMTMHFTPDGQRLVVGVATGGRVNTNMVAFPVPDVLDGQPFEARDYFDPTLRVDLHDIWPYGSIRSFVPCDDGILVYTSVVGAPTDTLRFHTSRDTFHHVTDFQRGGTDSCIAVVPAISGIIMTTVLSEVTVFASTDVMAQEKMSHMRVAWMGAVAFGRIRRSQVEEEEKKSRTAR